MENGEFQFDLNTIGEQFELRYLCNDMVMIFIL